jgi:hypothetical protein
MYQYITKNNIDNPQYYMYTKFEGVPFLNEYVGSRKSRIDALNKIDESETILKIAEYLAVEVGQNKEIHLAMKEDCISRLNLQSKENKETTLPVNNNAILMSWFGYWSKAPIKCSDKILSGLALISLTSNSGEIIRHLYKWLSIYTTKYEVFKRLLPVYDHNFKIIKSEQNKSHHRLYVYFSLASLLLYSRTSNLKFLNVALKLCDLLCSIDSTIIEKDLRIIYEYCLNKEVNFVTELISIKKVSI